MEVEGSQISVDITLNLVQGLLMIGARTEFETPNNFKYCAAPLSVMKQQSKSFLGLIRQSGSRYDDFR